MPMVGKSHPTKNAKLSKGEGRQHLFVRCGSVLREVIGMVCGANPFSIEAWVLLSDHMHCMWRLLDGDTDDSLLWALIYRVAS